MSHIILKQISHSQSKVPQLRRGYCRPPQCARTSQSRWKQIHDTEKQQVSDSPGGPGFDARAQGEGSYLRVDEPVYNGEQAAEPGTCALCGHRALSVYPQASMETDRKNRASACPHPSLQAGKTGRLWRSQNEPEARSQWSQLVAILSGAVVLTGPRSSSARSTWVCQKCRSAGLTPVLLNQQL